MILRIFFFLNIDQSPTIVECDQQNDGGGWTVWLRRLRAGVDFNITWAPYKSGFGGDRIAGDEFLHFNIFYNFFV